MKKYVTISLFTFFAILLIVIVAGSAYRQNGSNAKTSLTGSTTAISVTLSKAELAKHNFDQSCWLLISGKIYDVTSYINGHPGGRAEILNSCGTDATEAFDTKGGQGRPHSTRANSMLADYYIGDLGQTANVKQ